LLQGIKNIFGRNEGGDEGTLALRAEMRIDYLELIFRREVIQRVLLLEKISILADALDIERDLQVKC